MARVVSGRCPTLAVGYFTLVAIRRLVSSLFGMPHACRGVLHAGCCSGRPGSKQREVPHGKRGASPEGGDGSNQREAPHGKRGASAFPSEHVERVHSQRE